MLAFLLPWDVKLQHGGGFWRKASYRLGWMFSVMARPTQKQDHPVAGNGWGCKLGSSCISAHSLQ